jgi:putative transposase
LYYRFSLSLRDVEELLAKRGITVTHETIRQWCRRTASSGTCSISDVTS